MKNLAVVWSWLVDHVEEAMILSGAAMIVWSAWQTSPALGKMVAGILLLAGGFRLAQTREPDKPEADRG